MEKMQISLEQAGFGKARLKNRERAILEQINVVVPWSDLIALIERHRASSVGHKGGRLPFASEMLLRQHFCSTGWVYRTWGYKNRCTNWLYTDNLAGLDAGKACIPEKRTNLRFRHLLERHQLAQAMFAHVNAPNCCPWT